MTYLSVVFGELVPKALTLDRAETLAALVARPVELMAQVLRPGRVGAAGLGERCCCGRSAITDVMAGDVGAHAEELRALVDEAEGSGVIPRAQEELLHNVFDFADREVRDVMVPSPDVAWLEAYADAGRGRWTGVVETSHERYPGRPRSRSTTWSGIVHVRDLIASPATGRPVGALARARRWWCR